MYNTELKKQKVKSYYFCYHKVGRAITLWGAIMKKLTNWRYTKNYFAFCGHHLSFLVLYVYCCVLGLPDYWDSLSFIEPIYIDFLLSNKNTNIFLNNIPKYCICCNTIWPWLLLNKVDFNPFHYQYHVLV